MSGFLYYIPKHKSVGRKIIAEAGLASVIVDNKFAFCPVENNGPDGGVGIVLSPHVQKPEGKQATTCGYYPKLQTWLEWNGFWIGYETEAPPRPVDLERAEIIEGHEVELADGKKWTIPIARTFDAGTRLPESMVLGRDGKVVRKIIPKYAEFSAKAEKLAQEWSVPIEERTGEDQILIDDNRKFGFGAEALSINYLINEAGISLLDLFTTVNIIKVLGAVVDVPTYKKIMSALKEADKKKDHASSEAGSDTSGGETVI